MRTDLLLLPLALALVPFSVARGDEYQTAKSELQKQIAAFDKTCALATLTEDGPLFRYVKERASFDVWTKQWSPRKVMTTLIDLTGRPSETEDARNLWVIREGLTDGRRINLDVRYDTNEAKDAGFFKERRTCSDRLAAQASADIKFFVSAYAKTGVNLSYQGALTFTHGTWTSDVEAKLLQRDRELFRQLFTIYKDQAVGDRLAVISRIRAISILGTADRTSSARLEAGLSASGGISFASGDLKVDSSTSVGQSIELQTVDTLITTVKGRWIRPAGEALESPLPDIKTQELPSRTEVSGRLLEGVTLERDGDWLAEVATSTTIGIRVHGITQSECDSLTIGLDPPAGTQPACPQTGDVPVKGRAWDAVSQDCVLQVQIAPSTGAGECPLTFRGSYLGLELNHFTEKLFANAPIKGAVKVQGKAIDTQLARWDVEVSGGKTPFRVVSWDGDLTFSCPDNTSTTVHVTGTPGGSTPQVTSSIAFLATQPLVAGCRATPPAIQVVLAGGTGVRAPISGVLVAP